MRWPWSKPEPRRRHNYFCDMRSGISGSRCTCDSPAVQNLIRAIENVNAADEVVQHAAFGRRVLPKLDIPE